LEVESNNLRNLSSGYTFDPNLNCKFREKIYDENIETRKYCIEEKIMFL